MRAKQLEALFVQIQERKYLEEPEMMVTLLYHSLNSPEF